MASNTGKNLITLALLMSTLLLATALQAQSTKPRDLYADTWVATDDLGRSLPTNAQVGVPRPRKTVGMFYFLTFDPGGDGPYDNTKILTAHPEAMRDTHHPAWGPLNAAHYWGEPLFGYYASDDAYVLRKHAQMLSAAGVDVVIFDNSNAVLYQRAREKLCQVWEQMRREGEQTPQIMFLCPFGNGGQMDTRTLNTLYDTLYAPGRYADLWFRWNGKPLIMADPRDAEEPLPQPARFPAELTAGHSLGQTFTADKPFIAAGGEFPTWAATHSGMTLSLYAGGPGGKLLARQKFENVADDGTVLLPVGQPLPPGKYDLEMSAPVGRIGWWSYSGAVYGGGQAVEDGRVATGDRDLHVQAVGEAQIGRLSPDALQTTPEAAARRARAVQDFFTFRAPIAPYDILSPPPDHWAWLQVYPQAPQRNAQGDVEEVTVGVAQNYNAMVKHAAPMSFPGVFGRSYHAGHTETGPDAVWQGFNFAEQWDQALKLDPPFVFVTGWNEWTAGFYDNWAGFQAPPPIFVDEFSEEGSRDIEPMRGGHGDDYYYQFVAAVRRYKGVRPLPPVTPRPITIDGRFDDWRQVKPEFRDAAGDTAHRNAVGVGKAGTYRNSTGRNDIVAAKVSYDAKNVYFYVRTAKKLTPRTDPDWMLLYLDVDANVKTGWLGYDFVVNRQVGSLEKYVGGPGRWGKGVPVKVAVQGNEMEIAIPRLALGLKQFPATLDFKWADHCTQKGDWTDFTLNGDAAPDDRFNYRAVFTNPR